MFYNSLSAPNTFVKFIHFNAILTCKDLVFNNNLYIKYGAKIRIAQTLKGIIDSHIAQKFDNVTNGNNLNLDDGQIDFAMGKASVERDSFLELHS